jgi:O-antigen/teichoic acid export membrane protein
LVFVPIAILLTINHFSTEILLFSIFIALSLALLFAFLFIFISSKREISFLKLKTDILSLKQKRKLNKFIIALSAITLSSVLFGHIDIFILGRYVESEFLGFYKAAYSLITSAAPFISFSGALFPIFSKLKGRQLLRGLKKSIVITLLLAVPASILTFIISPLVVKIIYGTEYLLAANVLRLFSILIIILPLIAIYSSFLVSQNNPKKVSQSLILATILNIILNYVLIISLLPYGHMMAVYGATIATVISKIFYLSFLVIGNK